MGEKYFVSVVRNRTVQGAFWAAVEHAKETEGDGIYTGAIGEKDGYEQDRSYHGRVSGADALLAHVEAVTGGKFDDTEQPGGKWGPALFIRISEKAGLEICKRLGIPFLKKELPYQTYLFFGNASY